MSSDASSVINTSTTVFGGAVSAVWALAALVRAAQKANAPAIASAMTIANTRISDCFGSTGLGALTRITADAGTSCARKRRKVRPSIGAGGTSSRLAPSTDARGSSSRTSSREVFRPTGCVTGNASTGRVYVITSCRTPGEMGAYTSARPGRNVTAPALTSPWGTAMLSASAGIGVLQIGVIESRGTTV